ncbi:hypothetical protein BCR33DRAFT_851235 [Rhizoclosmatium globosum]|uniref:Uncharacterized protein n=1 Tax=Rhizoclosmatium globosum TaxID=329046 RepID=A0A1Y2C7I4_9FUNG|nr:hypothetical protein BCR33DRAFT_851235 [Rhizoclosmatium globosum]|eukprot:ORY42990.1 hypothetical protein BCR33DRAFT_851235 [Rhizoclosmatium globosum]
MDSVDLLELNDAALRNSTTSDGSTSPFVFFDVLALNCSLEARQDLPEDQNPFQATQTESTKLMNDSLSLSSPIIESFLLDQVTTSPDSNSELNADTSPSPTLLSSSSTSLSMHPYHVAVIQLARRSNCSTPLSSILEPYKQPTQVCLYDPANPESGIPCTCNWEPVRCSCYVGEFILSLMEFQ